MTNHLFNFISSQMIPSLPEPHTTNATFTSTDVHTQTKPDLVSSTLCVQSQQFHKVPILWEQPKEALPEDHMPDFHHYDDAKGISVMTVVMARFGGMKNRRRKMMEKTLCLTAFADSLQKDQTMMASTDSLYRALLLRGRNVALALFKKQEVAYYGVKVAVAPTHSAFIELLVWLKNLLISASRAVFEKKQGRKMNYNNQQPASFDRRKVTDVKGQRPIALVSVGSMVNGQISSRNSDCVKVEKVYGMHKEKKNGKSSLKRTLARFEKLFGVVEVFDLSTPSVFYSDPVEKEVKPLYSRFVKAGKMHANLMDFVSCDKVTCLQTQRPCICDSSLKTQTKDHPPDGDILRLCQCLMLKIPLSGSPRPVSAGWLNPAARPFFRPSSVYNTNWSNIYDPMIKGRWGTAVKTSAGYSWRNNRPQFWGSKSNAGSRQSTWLHT
ncbi:hypothetical protein Tco_0454872 [Tanacetum coccineum]